MTTSSIVATLTYEGGSEQDLVNTIANGLLFSSTTSDLPEFKASPITFLATGAQYQGNATNTTPPSGTLGEHIESVIASGSAVSLTNNTPANVTSISLTAGIWDVCGIVACQGITAGSLLSGSISTTSATNGTLGNNQVQTSLAALSSAQMVTIPPYRLELASTTTVYLVADASFTLGTVTGFGRISATRVG